MRKTGSTRLFFLYDANGLFGFDYIVSGKPQATYYYQIDGKGEIIGITDTNGNVVVKYTYDAWGNPTSITDANGSTITGSNEIGIINPFRYKSYYYDTDTGLYYLNSRYYDPQICRFVSADGFSILTASPTELTDKNLFSYCDNNPVMRADNGGQFWNIVLGAAVGAIIGAASNIIAQAASGNKINFAEVAVSAASGAVTGAITTACPTMGAIATGIIHGGISAGTYVATEIVNDRKPTASGVIAAGITAGVLAGGTKAITNFTSSKGFKIKEVGKLNASNHPNDPQLGIKFQINKANGKPTIRSFEFHYNHEHKGYKPHWQLNSWNPMNNSVSSKTHWTWWGRRI